MATGISIGGEEDQDERTKNMGMRRKKVGRVNYHILYGQRNTHRLIGHLLVIPSVIGTVNGCSILLRLIGSPRLPKLLKRGTLLRSGRHIEVVSAVRLGSETILAEQTFEVGCTT